jgi:hypothetical protein
MSTNQLQEVWILLSKNRLETVLETVAGVLKKPNNIKHTVGGGLRAEGFASNLRGKTPKVRNWK